MAAVHGSRHPELNAVRDTFAELRDELESHMLKEEQVLFPACRQMDASGSLPTLPCGSLGAAVARMEAEHDVAGSALETLRDLTHGYAPPPDACNSYRALLDGLATLEADLHQHIHKENNMLFPRALAMEAEFSSN